MQMYLYVAQSHISGLEMLPMITFSPSSFGRFLIVDQSSSCIRRSSVDQPCRFLPIFNWDPPSAQTYQASSILTSLHHGYVDLQLICCDTFPHLQLGSSICLDLPRFLDFAQSLPWTILPIFNWDPPSAQTYHASTILASLCHGPLSPYSTGSLHLLS